MENKQLLHVAVETLVLGGVTLFLTKKIKKCKEENDALREEFNKYKEQNDKNLKYLFSLIDSIGSGFNPSKLPIPPQSENQRFSPNNDKQKIPQSDSQSSVEKFEHTHVGLMPQIQMMDPISAMMNQIGVPLMNNEQIMMMSMQVENPRRRKNIPNIEPVSDDSKSILIQDDNNDDISEELQQLDHMNTRFVDNKLNSDETLSNENDSEDMSLPVNEEKQEEIFIPEPSKYKKKTKK